MKFLKILSSSFVGTTLMTAFSYLMSSNQKKLFKEPVLLNKLLDRSKLVGSISRKTSIPGWLIHYSIGTVFLLGYHYLWEDTSAEPSVASGVTLGLPSGLLGVAGWALLMRSHDNPPPVDSFRYYLHLLPAHVVFSLGAAAGYELIEAIKKER